ncbi:MAG: phosphodiester glycosidase family protein [Synergistaceae bacterium]|nr:phosphodiester glycosidase family protein [Synergistaceae bacterium]
MTKFFKRIIIILLVLINSCAANAVTRADFIARLLEVRGIDWSGSPEFMNNNGAHFMLRTGYITDHVSNLTGNITRREALRWVIQSLGLEFEAKLLNDYPSGFKDANKLNAFERGCLVVAANMNPAIIEKTNNFRGNEALSGKEAAEILEKVKSASANFKLDIIRNPLKGLRVFIHREGVPTGIPGWRVYADNLHDKAAAESLKKFLRANGFSLASAKSNGLYLLRSERLEDYNQVRRLTKLIQSRNINFRVLPSISNPNTNIAPRFWVMLTIDPTYWKISPVFSYNGPKELWPLSQIARQNKAKAAINAGFFAITTIGHGYPIGALKVNNEFINNPYEGRGCLGWNDDDEAIFSVASQEAAYWVDMKNIIQAGPLIIDEGMTLYNNEGFNNSLISARHPRSAVGLNQDGQWVFMVVDGRNGLHSSGATISELAEIMRAQRVLYALNLDGGGSSEIIINGKIYNSPSEGKERIISYALGVIALE